MLTTKDFHRWCDHLELPDKTRREIEIIRSSEPSRLVGGGKKNVSGRYPSRKMGVTIQFESHTVELPFIYQLEYDDEVLEFYDQPPPFKIGYRAESGRNLGIYITPDFFVIRTDGFEWVECKTEENWRKLAEEKPNRYVRGEDHRWRSPPAEQYANPLGGGFRLWSSSEIDWTLQRNLEFLQDYYRDVENNENPVSDSSLRTLLSLVSVQPGISIASLLQHAEEVTADDIYHLVADGTIYIDLNSEALVETDNCLVFPDTTTAAAYNSLLVSRANDATPTSRAIGLSIGTLVYYNGKPMTIGLVGETDILLKTENGQTVEFSIETIDILVRQGKITGIESADEPGGLTGEAMELYTGANEADLQKANQRYRLLQPYLDGEPIPADTPRRRSLYYWLADYRQAQKQYGYGYLGLLYPDKVKGNRTRKLPPSLLEIIRKFVTEEYETKKQKSKQAVYDEFVAYCSNFGIPDERIPSYKTFIREIGRRDKHEQTLAREGPRAAYALEMFYWALTLTTPRHGDFPFHIGHIDHTELDIKLRCSKTGKPLGNPWLTTLVDACTRCILAVYITFDPPSYRSCMMVLRVCVRRYGRLPRVLVTDNGKEFHSVYFETLLALFDCTLKHRPPAKARFGGVCERLFGTANTQLIHNLAGNTQISKKVRLMTKSVNPENLSLWTLGLLYLYLREWAYEVYETTEHPALEGQSPREAYLLGIERFGSREHRRIPYDDNFRILTLPTTERGRARVQVGKGIKIYHKYYWSNAFRDPEIENTSVEVRYDPFNAGIAYAYVRGQWVQCISEYYPLFQGRSEREIQLATASINQQKRNHARNYKIRARQLGQFLAGVESQEVLLEQRLRDEQAKEIFRVIDGGLPDLHPYTPSLPTPSDTASTTRDNIAPETEDLEPAGENSNLPIHPSKLVFFKTY
jgi:transposase InsO family protein